MKFRILSLLAAGTGLWAQGVLPAPPRPSFDELKTFLGLTDSQVQALQDLRRQEAQALQTIHQEIGQKERTLHEQIRGGSTDALAIGTLLLDIESLRKRVAATDGDLRAQAVNTLTPEQKTKLNLLQDAARLQPVIHQAVGLGLMTFPENSGGAVFNPAPRFLGGPRMRR